MLDCYAKTTFSVYVECCRHTKLQLSGLTQYQVCKLCELYKNACIPVEQMVTFEQLLKEILKLELGGNLISIGYSTPVLSLQLHSILSNSSVFK